MLAIDIAARTLLVAILMDLTAAPVTMRDGLVFTLVAEVLSELVDGALGIGILLVITTLASYIF